MAERQFYPNAPVTEAVLEIRVTPAGPIDPMALNDLLLADEYPNKSEIRSVEGTFALGPEIATTARQSPAGYLYRSPDDLRVLIARVDLFAASRLAPYRRWEDLRDEAKRLWPKYRDIVQPSAYPRLGLRYVNKLDLPLPMDDLSDYLATAPVIAAGLPQGMIGYLMQLQIPNVENGILLTLRQAMLPIERDAVAPILLDIDVSIAPDGPLGDDDLWTQIEGLHAEANRAFESCITERTKELIA